MEKKYLKLPCQEVPNQLFLHAIEHCEKDTEFDQIMAFLLIDIGVETLLKFYLCNEIKINYSSLDRIEYYDLVDKIVEMTEYNLEDCDLPKIIYYHNIRNNISHLRDDVMTKKTYVEDYSKLAIKLMNVLLNIKVVDNKYLNELIRECVRKDV